MLDQDMDRVGVWFRSVNGRWLALFSANLGVIGALGFVLLDEYWLDLPGWLPFLPSIISNGWIPMAGLILILIGFYESLKSMKATDCEARQALFTLLFTAFITLTIVGIFFRGEGMALILPWS